MGGEPKGEGHGCGVDETVNEDLLGKEMALLTPCHPIILEHPIAD